MLNLFYAKQNTYGCKEQEGKEEREGIESEKASPQSCAHAPTAPSFNTNPLHPSLWELEAPLFFSLHSNDHPSESIKGGEISHDGR